MRIAVCDDETFFRTVLKKELTEYAEDHGLMFIISDFKDGSELLASNEEYDLIFLDYKMSTTNGIATIEAMRKRNDHTAVIFVSSYREIVFESLKYKTFRFLLKPLDKEKLWEALDSIIKEKQEIVRIIVKDEVSDKNITVPASEIIYCQADNNYVTVVTANGSFKYQKKISHLENELGSGAIFRTNRSYLVNFDHIRSYDSKEITLSNGHKALISKNVYNTFKKTYLTYLKNKSVG